MSSAWTFHLSCSGSDPRLSGSKPKSPVWWWRGELVGIKERRWMWEMESMCVLERNRGEERVGVIPLSLHTHIVVDDPILDSPGDKLYLPAKDPSR